MLVVDPFLRYLKDILPDAVTRAFADDIGMLIQRLEQTSTLSSAFSLFEKISGLALKPSKCNVVPLGKEPSESWLKEVKTMLSGLVPNWSASKIVDKAEYLGMILGPNGGCEASWQKPIKKFVERSHEIAKAGFAPSLGCDLYTIKGVPTLSYVPQLNWITPEVNKQEFMALQRIFHLPHNGFPAPTFAYLHEIGFRKIVPFKITAEATIIRAAIKTCKVWREELKGLKECREGLDNAYGPLAIRDHNLGPLRNKDTYWWKSPSFTDMLSHAVKVCQEDKINTSRPRGKPKESLQANITGQLIRIRLNTSLAESVAFRIKRFFPAGKFDEAKLIEQLNLTIDVAKKLPPSIGLSVIKTWTNAWTTDRRMSNRPSKCRFGCPSSNDNDDSLDHYLMCTRLHNPIKEHIKRITFIDFGTNTCESLTLSFAWQKEDQKRRLAKIFSNHVALDLFSDPGS